MFVDNLFKKKKSRINSDSKGKRGERNLVDILNNRFHDLLTENHNLGKFSRTVGSGNRGKQKVYLSQYGKVFYSSDLVCPPNFIFTIECKNGYNDIDLFSLFNLNNKTLDSFLEQVANDASQSKKEPMLVWKKDRKKYISFVREKLIKKKFNCTKMYYGKWIITSLENLLSLPDEFFFNNENKYRIC